MFRLVFASKSARAAACVLFDAARAVAWPPPFFFSRIAATRQSPSILAGWYDASCMASYDTLIEVVFRVGELRMTSLILNAVA